MPMYTKKINKPCVFAHIENLCVCSYIKTNILLLNKKYVFCFWLQCIKIYIVQNIKLELLVFKKTINIV